MKAAAKEGSTLRVGEGRAALHHKCWMVDGTTLLAGSVNPTYHALERNEEDLLVCRDPVAVGMAEAEWHRLSATARRYSLSELRSLRDAWQQASAARRAPSPDLRPRSPTLYSWRHPGC